MRNLCKISYYVVVLFIVETFLQIVFYSIRLKYFDSYNQYEKMDKILLDGLYVIGTVKLVFFLPLYLILYLVFIGRKNNLSIIKQSIYHTVCFLLIYTFLSFLLPGNLAGRIIDTIILTVIAFITSFFFSRVRLSKVVGD
jgi:hypothetical protein